MFNKLKQFKDLRDTAKQMQSRLAEESVTVEKGGVTITLNGNMEITNVSIADGLSREKTEQNIKDGVNDAIEKAQKIMARKMREMGGFPGMRM